MRDRALTPGVLLTMALAVLALQLLGPVGSVISAFVLLILFCNLLGKKD